MGQVDVVAVDLAPGAHRLLQHPQAHDVAQVADGPVDAGLVGEVGPAARLGEHRRVELEADQGPRPARDVREVRCGRGHGHDRGRGVVRADRPHGHVGAQPELRQHRAEQGARLAQRRQERRVDAQSVREVERPLAGPCVEQPGGRRVRDLGALHTREPGSEQVGDEQHPVGGREVGGALRGDELEDRVELLRLQAGARVELVGRDRREDPVRHAVGAVVAVVDGRGRRGLPAGRPGRSRPPTSRCRCRRAVRRRRRPCADRRGCPPRAAAGPSADRPAPRRPRWGTGRPRRGRRAARPARRCARG